MKDTIKNRVLKLWDDWPFEFKMTIEDLADQAKTTEKSVRIILRKHRRESYDKMNKKPVQMATPALAKDIFAQAEKRKITKVALAERIDVSTSTLEGWKKGTSFLSLAKVAKMCKILDLELRAINNQPRPPISSQDAYVFPTKKK